MKAEWPSICSVHVMLALLWRGLLLFFPLVTTECTDECAPAVPGRILLSDVHKMTPTNVGCFHLIMVPSCTPLVPGCGSADAHTLAVSGLEEEGGEGLKLFCATIDRDADILGQGPAHWDVLWLPRALCCCSDVVPIVLRLFVA